MSRRYGRNQKRRARQDIARLSALLEEEKKMSASERAGQLELRRQINSATEIAFDAFIQNTGLYATYVDDIARKIGQTVGEELKPIAQKLLQSQKCQPQISLLSDSHDLAKKSIRIIEGKFPAFHYRVAVTE